jgi:hypothetical protein
MLWRKRGQVNESVALAIGHFNQDQAIESSSANLGRWTLCMTMDIREVLLHHAKNSRFPFL